MIVIENIFKEYPDIVNVTDLQKLLHIGRNKAYELLKNKSIQSIKIGRDYKIPKQYIINYINETIGIQNNSDICYNVVDFKSRLPLEKE